MHKEDFKVDFHNKNSHVYTYSCTSTFGHSFMQCFLLSQMQQLETQVLEAERRAYEANQQVNTNNSLVDISSDFRHVKYLTMIHLNYDSLLEWLTKLFDYFGTIHNNVIM